MNGVYDFGVDVSELPQVCKMHPVYGGHFRPAKIIMKNLEELTNSNHEKIIDLPHYQYCIGNKQAYADFLIPLKGKTWARAAIGQEHLTVDDMFANLDKLINSTKKYLEPPFENNYICTFEGETKIFDGCHRSSVLLAKGFKTVPIAVI
jgi:hypothetical protein